MIRAGFSVYEIDGLKKNIDQVTFLQMQKVIDQERSAEYELLKLVISEATRSAMFAKKNDYEKWRRKINKRLGKLLGEDKEKKSGRNLAALFRRKRRG